jgi:hypothetical protein
MDSVNELAQRSPAGAQLEIGNGGQTTFLVPLTPSALLPPSAYGSDKLYYFIAQDNRNTTKHFSQQICHYRPGGFTRLHGLPALLPEERWIVLDVSKNSIMGAAGARPLVRPPW